MIDNSRALHVVPGVYGGWVVKRKYAVRALKHFETKRVAIRWARWKRAKGEEIVVHKRDGVVGSII